MRVQEPIRRNVMSRHFLNVLGTVLFRNRIGIILNVVVFFLLWMEPQGKDLVLSINQDGRWPVVLFYTLVLLLSALVWYTPRFLYKDSYSYRSLREFFRTGDLYYYDDNKDPLEGHLRRMVPRILGTMMLLIAAFAFLNILIEYNYNIQTMRWPFIGIRIHKASHPLLLSCVFLWLLLYVPLYKSVKQFLLRYKGVVVISLVSLFVVQMVLIWTNKTAYTGIQELLWMGLALAVSFAGFVMARKSIYMLRKITSRLILYTLLCSIVLGSMILFLSNTILMTGSLLWQVHIFHPLIIVFSGFVMYTALAIFLIFLGKATQFKINGRILKLQYLSSLLLVLFVFTQLNRGDDHYNITVVPHAKVKPDERPGLTNYFDNWLKHRQGFIRSYIRNTGHKFPILIVSAEGGGSRAALWTLTVNSFIQMNNPNYYNWHTLAFTNASGGGTGNSMFFCFMEAGAMGEDIYHKSPKIFMHDYLSSSLALLLGIDSFQGIFGLNLFNDRAKVLETEWQKGMRDVSRFAEFDRPFLSYWSSDTGVRSDIPLLFLNTTSVQSGGHAITAPIMLNQQYFPNAMDLLTMVDTFCDKTVALSTAVLLNARFPFVNPAGVIPGTNYQFGDAGYYDNYGAENAANLIRGLKSHLARQGVFEDSLEFVSIVIENSTVEDESTPDAKSQVAAPLNALIKVRSANSRYALMDLERTADVTFRFPLELVEIPVEDGSEQKVIPGIPLARHLSNIAVRAIRAVILDEKTQTNKRLKQLLARLDQTPYD